MESEQKIAHHQLIVGIVSYDRYCGLFMITTVYMNYMAIWWPF
jgi:hypothetical protein